VPVLASAHEPSASAAGSTAANAANFALPVNMLSSPTPNSLANYVLQLLTLAGVELSPMVSLSIYKVFSDPAVDRQTVDTALIAQGLHTAGLSDVVVAKVLLFLQHSRGYAQPASIGDLPALEKVGASSSSNLHRGTISGALSMPHAMYYAAPNVMSMQNGLGVSGHAVAGSGLALLQSLYAPNSHVTQLLPQGPSPSLQWLGPITQEQGHWPALTYSAAAVQDDSQRAHMQRFLGNSPAGPIAYGVHMGAPVASSALHAGTSHWLSESSFRPPPFSPGQSLPPAPAELLATALRPEASSVTAFGAASAVVSAPAVALPGSFTSTQSGPAATADMVTGTPFTFKGFARAHDTDSALSIGQMSASSSGDVSTHTSGSTKSSNSSLPADVKPKIAGSAVNKQPVEDRNLVRSAAESSAVRGASTSSVGSADSDAPTGKNVYIRQKEFIEYFRQFTSLKEAVTNMARDYPPYKEVSIYARARRYVDQRSPCLFSTVAFDSPIRFLTCFTDCAVWVCATGMASSGLIPS